MISETNKDVTDFMIRDIVKDLRALKEAVAALQIPSVQAYSIGNLDASTIIAHELTASTASIQNLTGVNAALESLNAQFAQAAKAVIADAEIAKARITDLDIAPITLSTQPGADFAIGVLGDFEASRYWPAIPVAGTLNTTEAVNYIPSGTNVPVTGVINENSGIDNLDDSMPGLVFLSACDGSDNQIGKYLITFTNDTISVLNYTQSLSSAGNGNPLMRLEVRTNVAGAHVLVGIPADSSYVTWTAKYIGCYTSTNPLTPTVTTSIEVREKGSILPNMAFNDLTLDNLTVTGHTELNTVHAFDLIADNLTIDNITFVPDNFDLHPGWYTYDILTKGVGGNPGTQNSAVAFFYFYNPDQIGPDDKPIDGESPQATIIFNKSMEKTFMINSSNVQFYADRYGYNILGSNDPDYFHIVQDCHLEVMLVSERAIITLEATSTLPTNDFLLIPGMVTNSGDVQNLIFNNASGSTLTITDSLSFPDSAYEKVANRLNTIDDAQTGGGNIPTSTQYAGGQGVLDYFSKKIVKLPNEAAFQALMLGGNLVPETLYFYPDVNNDPSVLIDDGAIANNKTWSSYHIDDLVSQINQTLSAMSVSGIFIGSYNFYADEPTDTQFTTWVLTQRPTWTTPRDGATVVNIYNNHQWRFDSTGFPRQWIDMGQAFVAIATDMNAGIVLSTIPVNTDNSTFGTVSVGSTGKMSINNIYLENEAQYNPALLGLHLRIQDL